MPSAGSTKQRPRPPSRSPHAEESYRDSLQQVADAASAVKDAERGVHEAKAQAAQQVAAAEEAYRDSLQQVADAASAVKDAERSLHEAKVQAAQAVADAEEAYRDSLRQVADAARAVKDAERGLHEAQVQAAQGVRDAEEAYAESLERVRDAAQSVRDSQRALSDATRDARDATRDYNEALATEGDRLLALQYRLQGLQLSQQQAAIDVVRAQQELQSAFASGDPLAVQEAAIRLQQAQLAQKSGVLDVKNAEQELAEARRNGTQELQSAAEQRIAAIEAEREAQRGLIDSLDAYRDAQIAAAEAFRGIHRAEVEGRRQIADAQRALRDAERAYRDALEARREAFRGIHEAEVAGRRQIADAQRALNDAQRSYREAVQASHEAFNGIRQAEIQGRAQIAEAQRSLRDAQRSYQDAVRDSHEAFQGIRAAEIEGRQQIREAQRGVIDAERQYRDALRASRRAARGINEARAEGAAQVAEAVRGVAAAERAYRDAVRASRRAAAAVDKARRDGARSVRDAQLRVADAVRAVRRAHQNLREAQRGNVEQAGALEKAWRKYRPLLNQTFRPAMRQARLLGNQIKAIGRDALPFVGRASRNVLRGMNEGLRRARRQWGPSQRNSLNGVIKALRPIFRDLTVAMTDFFMGFIGFTKAVMPQIRQFARWIRDVARRFNDWANSERGRRQIRQFMNRIVPVAREFALQVWRIARRFIELAQKHGPALRAAIRAVGRAIVFVLDVGDKIITTIRVLGNAGKTASPRLRLMIGAMKAVGRAIAGLMPNLRNLRRSVRTTVDFIGWIWGKLPDRVGKHSKAAADRSVGPFKDAHARLVGNSIIPDIVRGVIGWFGKLLGRNGPADATRKMVSAVLNAASGLGKDIYNALRGIGTGFYSLGVSAISGFARGFFAYAQKIAQRIFDFFRGVIEAGRNALNSRSPSREFANLGADSIEGYVQGVLGQRARAEEATRSVMRSSVDAALAEQARLRMAPALTASRQYRPGLPGESGGSYFRPANPARYSTQSTQTRNVNVTITADRNTRDSGVNMREVEGTIFEIVRDVLNG